MSKTWPFLKPRHFTAVACVSTALLSNVAMLLTNTLQGLKFLFVVINDAFNETHFREF